MYQSSHFLSRHRLSDFGSTLNSKRIQEMAHWLSENQFWASQTKCNVALLICLCPNFMVGLRVSFFPNFCKIGSQCSHYVYCISVNRKSPRFGRSGRGETTGVTSGESAPFAVVAPEAIFRKFPTGFPTQGTKDRESLEFPLLRGVTTGLLLKGRGVTTGETEEPLDSPLGDNPKTYQISIHISFAIFYT